MGRAEQQIAFGGGKGRLVGWDRGVWGTRSGEKTPFPPESVKRSRTVRKGSEGLHYFTGLAGTATPPALLCSDSAHHLCGDLRPRPAILRTPREGPTPMMPSGTQAGLPLPLCLDSPPAWGMSTPSPEPQCGAVVLRGDSPPPGIQPAICAAQVPTPWAASLPRRPGRGQQGPHRLLSRRTHLYLPQSAPLILKSASSWDWRRVGVWLKKRGKGHIYSVSPGQCPCVWY